MYVMYGTFIIVVLNIVLPTVFSVGMKALYPTNWSNENHILTGIQKYSLVTISPSLHVCHHKYSLSSVSMLSCSSINNVTVLFAGKSVGTSGFNKLSAQPTHSCNESITIIQSERCSHESFEYPE